MRSEPKASPSRELQKRNRAETCARSRFGASSCIAAVDGGIGKAAKKNATDRVAAAAVRLGANGKKAAGSSTPSAPITPVRIGASTNPRARRLSMAQPLTNTPPVHAIMTIGPST